MAVMADLDDLDLDLDLDLESILSLLGSIMDRRGPTGSYLRGHRGDLERLKEQEKTLQRTILQAAGSGDPSYYEVLRRALRMLKEVQKRLMQADPRRKCNGLNFSDGRGEELLWTKQFYSPLMHACEGGTMEMVKLLLDNEAEVQYIAEQCKSKQMKKQMVGSRMSAMHVACLSGRHAVVERLIEGRSPKALLNAGTKDKWTPLMYAVKEGHTDVVKVLLEQKELEILAVNKRGQTVLHIAGSHGQIECFEEIHASLELEATTKENLLKSDNKNPYLMADKKGYNVLHRVCKGPEGTYEGANITVKIMQWMFMKMAHLDSPEVLNMMKTEEGYSCLLLACDCNNRDLVEYLLNEKRVDVHSTTNDGKTGLHLAALHDYPDVADILMDKGVSLIVQDNGSSRTGSKRDTALHIAVRKCSASVEEKIRRHRDGSSVLTIQNELGELPHEVKPEEIIPQEIVRLGDAAVNRYRKLLRSGKQKKMPRCNLIALGEKRVGKTCVLCLLMGGKFIPDRDPTRGIENEVVGVTITTTVSLSSETWNKENPADITRRNKRQHASSVGEAFQSDLAVKPTVMHVPDPDELMKEIDEIEKFVDEVDKKVKTHALAQPEAEFSIPRPTQPRGEPTESSAKPPERQSTLQLKEDENPSLPPQPNTEVPRKPSVDHPKPAMPRETHTPQSSPPPTAKALPIQPDASGARGVPLISRGLSRDIVSTAKGRSLAAEPLLQYNTLDFAGQLEYRAMHHCFIVRRAIYLVVFNLQCLKRALEAPSDTKWQKGLEEIRYWMNSIHAHVHKMGSEPHLKRIILVGTHSNPPGEDPITDEDLAKIDAKLIGMFESTPIFNDMFRAEDKLWIAAVENSLDQQPRREESGAVSLQRAIHDAWNDLPFKNEQYPTTWLLFEAYLQERRSESTPIVDAKSMKEAAREKFGIGEEEEEDIEMALGFFHDIGTIVYPRKLPTLYVSDDEKRILDGLILLDPNTLTRLMRNVMELKTGKGSKLTNDEMAKLEETGRAKLSVLRKCWLDLREDFPKFILMLQSFCLVFPLPEPAIEPTGTAMSSRQGELDPPDDITPVPDRVYLIPSKLRREEFNATCITNFNFPFEFDFGGFLPDEVYYRLLCLMLKDTLGRSGKGKGVFTATYFKICGVQKCNWVVQMVDCKLRVWVKYPKSFSNPPSYYVDRMHTDYLSKICNENGSSLQGLEYTGGPVHICEDDHCAVVVPCVSFPGNERRHDWECGKCLTSCNIDKLLDFKFEGVTVQEARPISTVGCGTGVKPSSVMENHPTPTQSRSPTKTDSGIVFPDIRGADIVTRTTVEITPDQPLDFDWEGHGFRVYLPAGAVSRRVTLCIQASLSGDYQLPDDAVLVSGVYWLSLHPHIKRFQKKATITLQHCANDLSSVSFVTTRCTQEQIPYIFKKLPEALFSLHKEGTIQVDNFSGFGISGSISEYAIRSYYIPKKPNVFDVHITVTPNLALQLECVKTYYEKGDVGPYTIVYIEEEAIKLYLMMDSGVSEVKRHGWELRLLVQPATLQKRLLDSYEEGKLIPHFELDLKLREERNPQSFDQQVHFTGVQEPTSIRLTRDPATPKEPQITSDVREEQRSPTTELSTDDLFDINIALEPIAARWRRIGLALRLNTDKLDAIERDKGNCEDCLTEVLTLWLKKTYNTERFGEPSWEMLARAVGHPSGGNDPALAEKISKNHGGSNHNQLQLHERHAPAENTAAVDHLKTPLRDEDVQGILEDLTKITTEWKALGRALGLSSPTLDRIEAEKRENISECKYEMVKMWLRGADKSKPPTRASLVIALKNETVQHNRLAEEIAQRTQSVS